MTIETKLPTNTDLILITYNLKTQNFFNDIAYIHKPNFRFAINFASVSYLAIF